MEDYEFYDLSAYYYSDEDLDEVMFRDDYDAWREEEEEAYETNEEPDRYLDAMYEDRYASYDY